MDCKKANIQQLIPQRAPFVMVDQIKFCSENEIVTLFTVDPGNVLCEGGMLTEAGLIENIAQTAAAKAGYESLKENKPVGLGYISAVKNLSVFSRPKTETLLETHVRVKTNIMNALVVTGEIKNQDTTVARCDLNVVLEN